jgi:hypothetical protein
VRLSGNCGRESRDDDCGGGGNEGNGAQRA